MRVPCVRIAERQEEADIGSCAARYMREQFDFVEAPQRDDDRARHHDGVFGSGDEVGSLLRVESDEAVAGPRLQKRLRKNCSPSARASHGPAAAGGHGWR